MSLPEISPTDLAAFQRAAVALLRHGLVTTTYPDAQTFERLRRWYTPLQQAFEHLVGWGLRRERGCFRLDRELDAVHDQPWWTLASGDPPRQRHYVLLSACLAALVDCAAQVTLSELSVSLQASARRAGVAFDPQLHPDRLAFCHVMTLLEALGLATPTDGSLAAWRDQTGDAEALYDVDHDVLLLWFHPFIPLQHDTRAHELLAAPRPETGRDEARRHRRRRVLAALLDRPVVYFDDLPADERSMLQHEVSSLQEEVQWLTGASLERRQEGVALVERTSRLSARAFTGRGQVTQAALLLATDLCALAGTTDQRTSRPPPPGIAAATLDGEPSGSPPSHHEVPFLPEQQVRERAGAHLHALGDAVNKAYADDPERFLRDAIDHLIAFDLVRRVPGGIVPLPALHRYRDAEVRPPPLTLPFGAPSA